MKIVVIALLLITALCEQEHIMYQGLRLDMSALTLNRDILATIEPGLNRSMKAAFHDYHESGSFGTSLYVKNVKIAGYVINEERFDMGNYTWKAPLYTLKGSYEAIYFRITFEYQKKWIGITISSGTGSARITNTKNTVIVHFNESMPDVEIPKPWEVDELSLSGNFPPTSWVQEILSTRFVHDFHLVLDEAMYDFAHQLLKTYLEIEDIMDEDIDLVFRNEIMEVKPTINHQYLSIAFKTNMTVNQEVVKKMYRNLNGTIVPQGDFDYCLNAELVPDVLDVTGKGGYHDMEVDAAIFDFKDNTVKAFFDILPTLKERYTGTEEFIIHCQHSRFETTNDLTQRNREYPIPQLQHPQYCFFYVASSGEYFLIVDIFLRFYYEMKAKDESFFGHVLASELYSFSTVPILPSSKHSLLQPHMEHFASIYSDSELISPGVRINPNRHKELTFTWAYIMTDEICFYFHEKKPILNSTKY